MNDVKHPILKDEDLCTGCGACIAICPQKAICKQPAGFGAWIPKIDESKCVGCHICSNVCSHSHYYDNFNKKAYIAYNKDSEMRKLSASGGVFSALASYILNCGGVVFGAEMNFSNGQAVVEHSMVTDSRDLLKILGSKYVQSDCKNAYVLARKALIEGKKVLFSGCSCQIDGLKRYLKKIDQKNLYTIDLICHGVPGIDLLNSYISFLNKKYKGKVVDFSFREKTAGRIKYQINVKIEKNTSVKIIKIPYIRSGYYRLFMGEEGYREACYHCEYASLKKPADLTIGDYFEAIRDYPDLFNGDDAINTETGISCVLSHTEKGEQLLHLANMCLFTKEVDPLVVQASHGNLCRPSSHTKLRINLLAKYNAQGYKAIERYYRIKNLIVTVPKTIIDPIRKRIHKQKK